MLASATFDSDGPSRRPSVQVGDPFMGKIMTECTLELYAAGSSSASRTSAAPACRVPPASDQRRCGGMLVELDAVSLRDFC